MTLHLRRAAPDDAPWLAVIELQTAPEFGEFVFRDLVPGASIGGAMTMHYGQPGPDGYEQSWMLQTAEGRVVGAMNAHLTRTLPPPPPLTGVSAQRFAHLQPFVDARPTDSLHIARLGVLPDYRRQGGARMLIAEAHAEARAANAPIISLFVWEDNAAARALYAAHGFSVAKSVDIGPIDGLSRYGRSLLMTKATT